jgi:hypothetical protein
MMEAIILKKEPVTTQVLEPKLTKLVVCWFFMDTLNRRKFLTQ